MATADGHFYTPCIPAHAIRMTATITSLTLDAFLAAAEGRAYRMALVATRRSADALDIVQDAMLQLVQHYRARPHSEWPLLFQRILQRRITDWHRQQTQQRRWFWQAPVAGDEMDDDPIAQIEDSRDGNPVALLERAGDIETVLEVLAQLPLRQQQAFMLRVWEGLDVADTASAMQCGEGSVKTHLFRALHTLRAALLAE